MSEHMTCLKHTRLLTCRLQLMTVYSYCAWCWSTKSQEDLNGTRVVQDKTKIFSSAVLLISFNYRGPETSQGTSMKFKSDQEEL